MTISLTKKERKHLIEVINMIEPELYKIILAENLEHKYNNYAECLESVKQKLSKTKPAPEDWPADY